MSTSRGFTLIELLVVIAIIGVLSSVVLASLNTARAKGNYASIISEMKQIETAAYLDQSSRGTWAPDVGTATNPFVPGSIASWPTPPCTGWTYDWENWENLDGSVTIRVTLRRPNVSPVYYYCIYTTGTCNYGDGYPIQDASPNQITCSE